MAILKAELEKIERRLTWLDMADRWTAQERDEYQKLIGEKWRLQAEISQKEREV